MRQGRIMAAVLEDAKIDMNNLVKEYVQKRLDFGMIQRDIAAECGVTASALSVMLKRHGIKLTRKVSLSINED